MLNCKHKHLLNFLFNISKNLIFYWMKYKNWNIKTNWLNTSSKTRKWNYFPNPLNNSKNNESFEIVSDARCLNSNTDQSLEFWPLQPVATQLARANKKDKSAKDLMYAYAYATLDNETTKMTELSSGNKFFASIRYFFWPQ